MRILHVITSLKTGGAESLMVDLLPLLRDEGRNVVDLLVFDGTRTQFMEALEAKGIKVKKLSKEGNVYHPFNIFKVIKFLRGYDIIHTHNTACQFYVPISNILYKNRSKLITTEHNSTNRRRSIRWFRLFDKWMYNQYLSIICISDQARRNLESYFGKKDGIITIYNGVDISRFLFPIKDISENLHFIITMVSAFRKQKDQETILNSMTRLPPRYFLKFVGSGETEENLRKKSKELGVDERVTFMGIRQDIPDILKKSDLIVLSSHWEGLSLSSIEGMASGRPFIASDVDGLREMVGGSGVLFEHGNDKDLAEKIQWLCEHPDEYRQVAQHCQEKARQYDISITAEKYLDLYHQVLR